MNILKKIVCTAILFSLTAGAFAQDIIYNDPFILDLVTRTWKGDDGLSGNSVTDIIQTSDGYIYLGTYDGLLRFDGVEFLSINKNTEPRVDFVSARTLFQDSKGNFWIGANDEGVTCMRIDGSVKKFNVNNGLPNNSIRAIVEDKNGTIWIGTSSGIAWINDYKVSQPEKDALPNENHILVKSLYVDKDGKVWVITSDGNGTLVYSNENFSKYTGIKKVNAMQITSVMQDSNDIFWFGVAPHYVVRYDSKKREESVFDVGFGAQKGTVVNCIVEDSFGNMWCGLDTGMTVIHDGKLSYMSTANCLTDEKIAKIRMDREKNIWIATDRGGIEKFSRTKFKTVDMGVSINAIARDYGRDVTWLAADNGLLCIKNGEQVYNEITEYCKNIRIRDVIYNEDGSILVSSYEKLGQLRIEADGTIHSWTKADGLTGNKVRVALEGSDGNLYIGTTTGLNIVDRKNGMIHQITKENGIENDYIMCIYETPDGTVWCGTDGGGVFLLRNGVITGSYTTKDGLAGNVVFKICSLSDGDMWICTGTGVTRMKNGKFFNFNAANGLGSDSVFQLLKDEKDVVWCTSNKGVFSIPFSALNDFADGKRSSISVRFHSRSDGIISGGVTSTSRSIIDKSGSLWFTLIDGFTKYDPSRTAMNEMAPIVHVQSLTIDNNKVITPSKRPVRLQSANKRVNIKYTGLSFIASEQVRFKYKLEGFEKEYSDWTSVRSVSYTNLKPGTYKFNVIAKNNDEIQSEKSAAVVIIKQAAFYQHLWFWIMCVVVFLALLYVAIKIRVNHLKADNNRLQKIYMEITMALTGTIDAKDKYTNGHSSRVAQYSKMIAERLGLSEKECQNIYMQAILHDIGKIGIPDSIINKPGKLTDEEFDVIKTHPVIGGDILKSITSLKGIEVGARSHHERYDGRGYPDGLKGEEIPFEARIIGVADAYDAMTSNRSYRAYLAQDVVREQIEKGKGSQFDPQVADKMLEIIDEDVSYKLHG